MTRAIIPLHRDATMHLSQLASDCCAYLAAADRAKNTIELYRATYAQLVGYITVTLKKPDDCRLFTVETVMGFMVALHQGGAGPNTIRTKMSALSSLARYGARVKDGRGRPVVPEDPTKQVDRPKRKRPAERYLLPAELAAFLSVRISLGESIARDLLVDTGLRASELCALTWGDLQELDGATSVGVVVKGGTALRVPISRAMSAALVDWRLHRGIPDPVERVLISPAGTPYTRTSLGQLIARLGDRAGITRVPVRPHIIRHTLNVIRRRAKIDPVTRSRLLTHTNLNSLHHYEHALDGELAAAREQQREGLLDYLSDYVPRLSAKAEPPRLNP